jgi:hypothetical protein
VNSSGLEITHTVYILEHIQYLEQQELIHLFTSTRQMPALVFPPFPDDVPTHPLLIIDYELLKRRDADEINRLWEASTKLGFW